MCLTYVPDASVDWAVMDVPALAGALLAEAGALLAPGLIAAAPRLVRWVARRQTAYGAWFYTDPPADSHITHDNYHTAIILDCLDRFRVATGEADSTRPTGAASSTIGTTFSPRAGPPAG